MGNLYTHIVRKNDPRVSVLWSLKLAWKHKPVDMNQIKELQRELREIEKREKKSVVKKKKMYIGQYG